MPEHLQSHIDYITPGVKLAPVVKRSVMDKRGSHAVKGPFRTEASPAQFVSAAAAGLPTALQNCSTNMTPTCIKALYSIPNAPAAVPGNSVGLFQQGSYFAESDVNLWLANFAPNVPQNTFPINASIDGASYSVPASSALNSGEALIDIEMT